MASDRPSRPCGSLCVLPTLGGLGNGRGNPRPHGDFEGASPIRTQPPFNIMIVGYTYNADNYCPDCTRTIAAFALAAPGEAAFKGRPSDGDNTEQFLDRWAARDGIDRDDEYSFDSGDFPKHISAEQLDEDPEYCGECFAELGA